MTNEEVKRVLKDKLAADLVDTVKEAANNSWSCEEDDDQMNTMLSVMSGGLPIWFTRAIEATKTIMQINEIRGLECLAALHFSTRRASKEQKLSAVSMLVQAISSISQPRIGALPFSNICGCN